jgi:hypothetical protein
LDFEENRFVLNVNFVIDDFEQKSVHSFENDVLVFFAKVAIFHNIIKMLFKLSLFAHLLIVKKALKYLF